MKTLKEYKNFVVNISDENYPYKLKQIKDSPKQIYYKGNIDIIQNQIIAIIGSRKSSIYGTNIAIDFAYKLSRQGLIISSGGARGIDSFANLGSVVAGKPTIMVLGNGIDYIYPAENKELEERVLANGGLILSEYEPKEKPSKETFPKRNRIISAISDGILVVEAREKSGTFITVDYALEQGKNVYAIPGSINQKNSVGTNELIKQGAKPVTEIEDIIEDFL